MPNHKSVAEQWLDREDNAARSGRLDRLTWLAREMPKVDWLIFRGGLMTKYLFEEARYCFVYGQFLATIVLSLALIERELAALFYESGRNDLERAGIWELAKQAFETGWLTQEEFEWVEDLRQIRNPIVHFRKLGVQPGERAKPDWWRDRLESRSVVEGRLPYEILEQDARQAMRIVHRLLGTSLMSVPDSDSRDSTA